MTNYLKIRSKDSSHVLLEFLQLLLYYDIHSIDLIDSLSWETLDAKSIFMFNNIKSLHIPSLRNSFVGRKVVQVNYHLKKR